MNLKPEFNQKQNYQNQNLEKSLGQPQVFSQSLIKQQDDQQSCCNINDEGFVGYVKAGTKKPSGLTAEKLKTFPGLADLDDEDAGEIAETLISLSQLAYEMFQLKQAKEPKEVKAKYRSKKQQSGCNKTVAVDAPVKQKQKVDTHIQKQPKENRVTSKATSHNE